jgi:peptidyl-prolyl cis-trans isomerase B (cyclophilin B)
MNLPIKTSTLSNADGLSIGQKLFFLGAVVAVCALFLRTRGDNGLKAKSMA